MEFKHKVDENHWKVFQRIYTKRCKREIELTDLVLDWFENEKEKSLDKLNEILIKNTMETKSLGVIVQKTVPVGRYFSPPFYREYEIQLCKPNRYAFLTVSEPFKPSA